nr:cobyric acid synthase CobQ [Clostridiales bacterium]
IFDEPGIAESIVKALYKKRGLVFDENAVFDIHSYKEEQYDLLAETVRESLDMDLIYKILEAGI